MHALAWAAARASGLVDYDCLLAGGSVTQAPGLSPIAVRLKRNFKLAIGVLPDIRKFHRSRARFDAMEVPDA
jgi:hypothetical protein